MTKTLSLFTVTACACAFSLAAFAADESYKAEKKQINADYKAAMAQCKTMKGDEKKACEKDAKAKRSEAMANEKAEHKEGKASSGASATPMTPSTTPAPASSTAPTTPTPPASSGGMGHAPSGTKQ